MCAACARVEAAADDGIFAEILTQLCESLPGQSVTKVTASARPGGFARHIVEAARWPVLTRLAVARLVEVST